MCELRKILAVTVPRMTKFASGALITPTSGYDLDMNQSTTTLTERQQRTGMRLVYFGQGTGVILPQLLIQSAFGVLFIKHLGGSDFQAMLRGSLLLLPRVLQIPRSLLVPPSMGKRFMLRCWLINGFAMASVLGVTFLPLESETIVVTGTFLGNNPSLWEFQIVIAVGLVFYFARNVFIARLPEGRSHTANNDYSNWRISLVGMQFNIFQFMLSIAGLALLVLIVFLLFVEDIRPQALQKQIASTQNNT